MTAQPIDFTALAREAMREILIPNPRADPSHTVAVIYAKLTQAHAAGRAEGLEEAAKLRDELSRLLSSTKLLLAEISDPGTEALAAIYCAERLLFEIALSSTPTSKPVGERES